MITTEKLLFPDAMIILTINSKTKSGTYEVFPALSVPDNSIRYVPMLIEAIPTDTILGIESKDDFISSIKLCEVFHDHVKFCTAKYETLNHNTKSLYIRGIRVADTIYDELYNKWAVTEYAANRYFHYDNVTFDYESTGTHMILQHPGKRIRVKMIKYKVDDPEVII